MAGAEERNARAVSEVTPAAARCQQKAPGLRRGRPGASERDNPDQGTIVTGVPRFTLLKKFSDMCSGMRMQP